jgi:quinol monooxygenase YgiN
VTPVRKPDAARSPYRYGGLPDPDGDEDVSAMIFITAKFNVRPEDAESWPDITRSFTEATRNEPGCMWFDWSRSLDNSADYILVEAFRDGDAGAAHVQSAHFRAAQEQLPKHLTATPKIISVMVDQDDWSELSELRVT